MYATRGDLRQHVTKVHRCGIYAKMPAGGLSIRQRPYSSSLKNSQRSSTTSTSPIKQQMRRRETVYRCSICRNKFPHTRAIERHHYDVHHIDPFDVEAMKNATIVDEEEIEDDHEQQQQSVEVNHIQQQEIHNRDEDEQMAIIQFRSQHQNAEQSPLIVKIERGLLEI
jgi:ribosomal protein S26